MTDGPVVFVVGGTVELHRRLTDVLSDLGLSLSSFSGPSAACSQATGPALILASDTTSGLSVSDVCRELRACSAFASIPLVAVASTDAEVSEGVAALQAGAQDVLTLLGHSSLVRARVANLLRLALSSQHEDTAAELHRSRQMLQLVLDNIPQRVFWKDRSSRYLGCNAIFARDAGLTDPAAIVGKTDHELSWKESADRYRNDDQLVMASGQAKTKYHELQNQANGAALWLETSKVPLRNPDGAIVGMLGTYEDITLRKEVEATMARRDRRLASMVRLLQRPAANIQEFMEFALDEAIALTGSKIGYIYSYDQDRRQFGLITWSKGVMKQCTVVNPQSVYDLDMTGAWGEVVRQGRPIVINDFENDRALCRGYPQGHAPLYRFASVPVVARDRIVGVAGVANKPEPYDQTDILQLTLLMEAAWKVLEKQQAEERLRRMEWMLSRERSPSQPEDVTLPEMVAHNTERTILDGVGETMLTDIASEQVQLLDTASAIVEANGDYASITLSSSWCRHLFQASRRACGTDDTAAAMRSGKWLCHESHCNGAARTAMRMGEPADIVCGAGIHVHAVPIRAGARVVGAMTMAYGDPPRDQAALLDIARLYGVDAAELADQARSYESRPPFIIDLAKQRLMASARLIGEIVERKQAEEALQRNVEEVEQFFAVAPELLCVTDAAGTLRKTSASWESQLGYAPAELHERNITDFVHPEDAAATTAAWSGLTHEKPRSYFVNRFRTRDGAYRHIEWHASAADSLVFASGRDISERLEAHAEIERLNERFQLAARSAELGVWDWDVVRNQLVWDDRMCALFGVRKEVFSGNAEAWEAALHPDDREVVHEAIRAALFAMHPFDTEVRAVWPSGEVRNVKAYGRVLRDADGQAIRMTGICYDITERKRAFAELRRAREEAEAAARAKSEFLANVSHEIRTPLNGILGLSHLALASTPNAKQRDYLNKIQSSGHALLDVINDVLDLSKMEAARFEIRQEPFALDHVLADVADTVGLAAEEKNVTLQFRTTPDVPLALHGDALRVRQVLMNLVSNAVKFTEHGQVEVTVALQARREMRASLAFTVKDTGIGMSNEQLNRLFQPFAQADGSVTRKYGGTGLGLVITKRLVQLMGGQIAVHSIPGQGSTFSFTLDFNVQADAANTPTTQSQLHVLVLDADASSRDYLSTVLSGRNFSVQTTASSAEVLAWLARSDRRFDAILVAWDALDQSGLEIAQTIRDARTPTGCPPILLISNQANDGIYDAVEAAGLSGLIRKPFRVSELVDAIMEAAGRQRSSATAQQAKADFAGIRILVVEDVELNRQILQELLEMAGASVEMAGNGREAIERLAKEGPPIDVVLMDVQMPEMDGLTATREIRAAYGSRPPIIAMTAHALEAERLRCLEAGMNDHLAKPVEPNLLFETLSKWTKRRARVVPTGPTASGSPELPGFDWDLALRRWNNNETRLRGALKRFADGYAKAADNIREALVAGDQTRACDLLHELKGVAGILGAVSVQQTAEALETEIKSGQGAPTSALMTTLSRTLDLMMQGVSQLAPVPVTTRSTSEIALPLIEMVRNLREIDELLAQNRLSARQRFASIKNALAAIHPAHTEQLEQEIMRLAYKSARQVVASLITQLKQPM